MQQRKLGKNGPKVSALGLGCMGMSVFYGPTDEKLALQVIQRAYEDGVTLFDTADMYGNGANEILLGKGIKNFRNQVVVSTKCGIEFKAGQLKFHNSPEYIRNACHASLKRLGTDKIDLFYLHRYNPQIPLEESMGAMLELIEEGKILHVGLSEVEGRTLEKAHKVLGDKLVALQSEFSLLNFSDAKEVLPACKKLDISFVAFSPLGRGLLGGKIKDPGMFAKSETFDVRTMSPQFQPEAFIHNLRFVKSLEAVAKKKKCTVAQLSLAWLLSQWDGVIPIPGTKKLDYLEENLGALQVHLTSNDLESIDQAIKENPIQGERLP